MFLSEMELFACLKIVSIWMMLVSSAPTVPKVCFGQMGNAECRQISVWDTKTDTAFSVKLGQLCNKTVVCPNSVQITTINKESVWHVLKITSFYQSVVIHQFNSVNNTLHQVHVNNVHQVTLQQPMDSNAHRHKFPDVSPQTQTVVIAACIDSLRMEPNVQSMWNTV